MTDARGRTWWRRERIGLVLLPVALIAAMAASSSRIHEYWWDRGFHDAAPRSAQGVVSIADEYDDGFLRYPIEADISLLSAEPVTELPGAYRPARVPTGSRLWEVRLQWDADPSVSLTGCSVALVEDDRLFVARTLDFDAGAPTAVEACVPDETPGPKPVLGSTAAPAVTAGESPRPQRWTTRTYVVAPTDAEPESVRVWWLLPTYAELPLS